MTRAGVRAAASTAAAAAATYRLSAHVLGRSAGTGRRWGRLNYRNQPVSLAEGPALTAALLVSGAVAPGLAPRVRMATSLAVVAASASGAYDDLRGASHAKGLRGHLRALSAGELSTGVVKAAAISGTSLLAANSLHRAAPWPGVVAQAALIAGSANLVNLFDLRPGRALKVSLLGALALSPACPPALVGSVLGGALAALPGDLAERTMLGDCGANALGVVLGCAASATDRDGVRTGGLALVVALTLLSERFSFSEIIERVRPLAAFDALGRRSC
jgi:UDP-N-acetylmuramyl pentapeptide phosphotransferase/UDP-N-acetylglucosamine-1-phosphate transferase